MLTQGDVERMPGVSADDRLRQFAGFSLFRRNSSLVANPTTQGVSLRGIGSSGASRTLVLWDGIPVNSPFGGWVYWTRLAPEQMERVEIARGASTSVFGDRAMGGSIGIFSPQPVKRSASLGYEGGNAGQQSVFGSGSIFLGSKWALSGAGRAFKTSGYYIVPPPYRGPVDTKANVEFAGGSARLDYMGASDQFVLRVDLLSEARDNGTQLQKNSTGLGTISGHYTRQQDGWLMSALAFHTREELRQSFSSVSANRQTERLTSIQSVPSEGTGGAGTVQRSGARGSWLAGGDFWHAEGYSIEQLVPTGTRTGGGTQTQYGMFGQGNRQLGRTMLSGGLRFQDPGSASPFWSPNGGVTVPWKQFRFRGSAYRAMRAPTLNELYREFRAGNTVTLPNAALSPETLAAVETGADWTAEGTRISVSAYYNRLSDLITNVTLVSAPNQIVRQRRNAAEGTVMGVEAQLRSGRGPWLFEASWLYADATFATGERIPQIPRNQGMGQLSWTKRRTVLSGGIRASSLQFDDDRNQFVLPGFAVFYMVAQQMLPKRFSVNFTMENIFNRTFYVGYTPTPQVGMPRLWRVGLRWTSR